MPICKLPSGLSITYDEAGNGAPLVLLHAFPLDRGMWKPQLAALGDAARVIAPDLPGFGESPATPFTIEGVAVHGIPGLINLFGIESPGLTSSLAIAEYVAAMTAGC